MIGSISEPSIAVVAMVEPEIAETTVPATTATTASRPGTCRIRRSMPSITLSASPVWNKTSPISTNSGIGVSEKLATATTLLRTICSSPAAPPRNSAAPIRLTARKEKATGTPANSSTVEPPSSNSAPICQDGMRPPPLGRRDRVGPRRVLGLRQGAHAKDELDGHQQEANRHGQQHPPFGKDQRFDRERAGEVARGGRARAVPDEQERADK